MKMKMNRNRFKVIEGNTSLTSNDNDRKVMTRTTKNIRSFYCPKYNKLVSDIAEMLISAEDFATCERCIVNDVCRRKMEKNQEALCLSRSELEGEISKKYGF